MTAKNPMTCDFSGKPSTQAFADSITDFTRCLGPLTEEAKAQHSFRVNRKFLWLWAYQETADGTLYLSVTLDHEFENSGVHALTQTSANRWTHQVEVKSQATAEAGWLNDLIREGYAFAAR
jgi:hypothetical protein